MSLFNKLGETWNLALRNNAYLLIGNLILSVALAISVSMNLSSHERIVLVPPHLDKRVEVAWRYASQEYLKGFGLYIATSIGSITPKNVQLVTDGISQFLSADIYPEVRSQLLSLVDDPVFQRANALNVFIPDNVVYEVDEEKRQKVFVVGEMVATSYLGGGHGSQVDRKPVVYELTMTMRDGRPLVVGFTSYPGKTPHTMKWRSSQPPEDPKVVAERVVLEQEATLGNEGEGAPSASASSAATQ